MEHPLICPNSILKDQCALAILPTTKSNPSRMVVPPWYSLDELPIEIFSASVGPRISVSCMPRHQSMLLLYFANDGAMLIARNMQNKAPSEAPKELRKTVVFSVNDKRKGKKVKRPSTASASTTTTQSKKVQLPLQTLLPAPKAKRSVLVLILEGAAVLAAIATIVAGTGYVLEKWRETTATVDFSGDIDQKKPFTLPLVAKNQGSIFSMHLPRMECSVKSMEYSDGGSHHVLAFANQGSVTGAAIAPNGTKNYFCDAPSALTLTDKPGGTCHSHKAGGNVGYLEL